MKKNNLMGVAVLVFFAFIVFSFVNVSADPPRGKGKDKKAYPIDIPKTGQTIPHGDRDDGELQMGIDWPDARFIDNEDGTVTDNLTGLIWLQDADYFGRMVWLSALDACNNLADDGIYLTDGSQSGDWRLPNIREVQSLVDYGENYPALPSGHPFTNVAPIEPYYWSSTTASWANGTAWMVSLVLGGLSVWGKTNPSSIHFLCVRDAD